MGLIPSEESSGGRQRLGHITKQGNSLLRFLLVEAAQAAARSDPEWRGRFLRLAMRRERRIAKVAMARKLAVRLFWMWRRQWDYQQLSVGAYGPVGVGIAIARDPLRRSGQALLTHPAPTLVNNV